MSLTIYRKYRPQSFSEVIGQEHIKKTLENEITGKMISHAYLFYGPRGTGKTTIARLFAKALNCEKRKDNESEPCNKCFSCQEISQGKNLDLIEIDAASNRGINEIRELREGIKFAPTHSKFKVFIIDECHQITTDAFNALLKTLEEPPAHAIFILVTTEPHKVPYTIASRCQKFAFSKVSIDQIFQRLKKIIKLEGIKIDELVLKNIARLSQGYVRDAESSLAQILSLGDKEITIEEAALILPYSELENNEEFIKFLFKKDSQNAIKLINQMVESGVDLKQFNFNLVEMLRKLLLFKISGEYEKNIFSLDNKREEELISSVKDVSTEQLIKIIEDFLNLKFYMETTEIPQLPFELAIIKICNL